MKIILFSAALFIFLLQQSQCQELAAHSVEDYAKESETKRDLLLIKVVTLFTPIASFAVDEGAKIFEKVLKDEEVLAHKTILKDQLANLTSFLQDKNELEISANETYSLPVLDLSVTMSEMYDALNYTQLSAGPNRTALELLDRRMDALGMKSFEKEFEKRYQSFFDESYKLFDEYFNSLNAAEKVTEAKMFAWYEKLKAENDIEKKIDMFSDLFDFFD